jgi:hypothetical protein
MSYAERLQQCWVTLCEVAAGKDAIGVESLVLEAARRILEAELIKEGAELPENPF